MTLAVTLAVIMISAITAFCDTTLPNRTESSWQTYSNKQYQFSLSYPKNLTPSTQFRITYLLGNNWMAMMNSADQKGNHPIIEIPITTFNLDSTTLTSLGAVHYYAAIRIGVSTNSKAVENCYSSNYQIKKTPVDINGTLFQPFKISDAAMSKWLDGTSYRIKRGDRCYALEFVETGTSMDDIDDVQGKQNAFMAKQKTLIAKQKALITKVKKMRRQSLKVGKDIINTFRFTTNS